MPEQKDPDLSRAAKKIADHKKEVVKAKKAQERKRAAYEKKAEDVVFQDMLDKLAMLIDRWDRLAKEGVGIKIGSEEEYRLSNEERITAMDKSEALKEYEVLIKSLLPVVSED